MGAAQLSVEMKLEHEKEYIKKLEKENFIHGNSDLIINNNQLWIKAIIKLMAKIKIIR